MLTNEMIERDAASAAFGMTLTDLGPGRAVVTMPVREDMLNGFAIVHGGIIFALADTAFALACNDGIVVTVAAGADITFLRQVRLGAVLVATAVMRSQSGRSGLYDVSIADQSGVPVAEFRGRSHTTSMKFEDWQTPPAGTS
jgi:acyl-CoA thioesterase